MDPFQDISELFAISRVVLHIRVEVPGNDDVLSVHRDSHKNWQIFIVEILKIRRMIYTANKKSLRFNTDFQPAVASMPQ